MGFQTHYRNEVIDDDVPQAWVEVIRVTLHQTHAEIGYGMWRNKAAFEAGKNVFNNGVITVNDQDAWLETPVPLPDGKIPDSIKHPARFDFTDNFSQEALSKKDNHPYKTAEALLKRNFNEAN